MKIFEYKGIFLLIVVCFSFLAWSIPEGEGEDSGGGKENVRDTVLMDMDELPPVCIDQHVLLTCHEKYNPLDILSYQWYVVNADNVRVPIAGATARTLQVKPKTTTTYQLEIRYILRKDEKIFNGDFEKGNTGFTTEYSYTSWINQGALTGEGKYTIGKNPNNYHVVFLPMGDHTSGKGNMMIANGDKSVSRNRVIWSTSISGLTKGEQYAFSAWGTMVGDINPPILDFSFNNLAMGEKLTPKVRGRWEQFYSIWTATGTRADISLTNQVKIGSGNDFAMDDISFAPVKLGVGEVTVRVLPQTDLQKIGDQDVCEGEDLSVKVNATGSNISKYEWIRTKDNLLVGTTEVLKIEDADMVRDGGLYRCTVTGVCGGKSDSIVVHVREKVRNNGVEVDTTNLCLNQSVELSAARISGYGLKYDWKAPAYNWLKAGDGWLPVTADEVTYRKPSAGLTDAGKYRCVVVGQCGRDTIYSMVNVEDGPRLKSVSLDTTVCPGAEVKLFVYAQTKNTAISWILPDNSVVGGERLKVVGEEQSKLYRYLLEKCGRTLSKGVLVNAFPPLQNVIASRDTAVCEGGTAVLQMGAQGVGLKYSWSRREPDGALRIVGHAARLVLSEMTEAKTGEYVGTVTDTCGNLSGKQLVKISLLREYEGLQITPNKVCCPGDNVKLEATGGKDGLKYDWTAPDGTNVSGAVLNIMKMDSQKAGKYVCKVTGVCQGVQKEMILSLKQSLQVSPSDYLFRVCEGERVVLRSIATGENVSYRWMRNGVEIGNADRLTLERAVAAAAGSYECHILSDCGDTTLVYRVDVKTTTRIVDHTPDHKYVSESDRGMLFVTASGERNSYVWKQDGVIVGDNDNYLVLPSFAGQPERDYLFTCEVSGDCGKDVVAINVHLRKFTQITQDTTLSVCKSSGYTFRVKPKLPVCPSAKDTTYRVEYEGRLYSTGDAMPFPAGTKGGLYVWHIASQCGKTTVRMNVVIEDVPSIDRIVCEGMLKARRDTVEICEGSDVRLVAQANRVHLYEWAKNGNALQVGTDNAFALKGVTLDMAGKYSCRVVNDCGEARKEVVVVVRKKVKVVAHGMVTQNSCLGDTVSLSVETNVDDAVFTWNGPSRANWVESSKGYISFYRNLAVNSEMDNGIYTCHAENACGSEEIQFNVDVEKTLVVTEISPSDTLCEGNGVVVFARVNVPATCTWTLPDGSEFVGSDLKIPSVTRKNAGLYRYHIQSRCVTDLTGNIEVAVFPALGELTLSSDTSVCENQPVDVTSGIKGARLTYSWRGPGGYVSDQASVRVAGLTGKTTGIYELTVKDICGQKQFGVVRLSILEDLKNLKISPDMVVCEGTERILEVEHDGKAECEWWFKGNKVAEGKRLSLSAVSAADTGKYMCRVKGACHVEELFTHVGLFRNLIVGTPDSLIRVCPGENVLFGVAAVGDDVRYVWTKDGSEVGYRENDYRIDDVIASDAGVYKCDISSVCGAWSVRYELQVKERTRVIGHSPDRFVSKHDSVRMVVRGLGEDNIYEWRRDGQLLSESGDALFIEDIGGVDTLNFHILLKGECGMDSTRIVVKVGEYKALKETQSPDTLCEGSSYVYVADLIPSDCYGDEVFSYEWTKDGKTIASDGSLLRLADLKPEDSGDYCCRVFCEDCGEISIIWKIYVVSLPEIVSITDDAFVTEGAGHRIEVVTKGEELLYSWKKDGIPYKNSQAVIDFVPAKYEDQGTYRVTVENRCSQESRETQLKVWRKTTIVTPKEQELEMCAGTDTIVQVEALGANGLIYKWYHNGNLLPVPMVGQLSLKDLKVEDGGIYECIVSGRGGDDSCFVYLNVLPLPKVELSGNWGICKNDLEQKYFIQGEDSRLLYEWHAEGGSVIGRTDMDVAHVAWNGEGSGVVVLDVNSSETGCKARYSHVVEYFPLPEVTLDLPDLVGYCIDSLKLEQGYPSGGYYLVNGIRRNDIRFVDKSELYPVDYYYADRCSSKASDTIGVAKEPFVKLVEEKVVTGWCSPVTLEVLGHSPGNLQWTGDGSLNVIDALRPVYTAQKYLSEDVKFKVEVTDLYGCKASDDLVVSLLPSPSVSIGKDTIIGICQDLVLKADYQTENFKGIVWAPANNLQVLDGDMARVLNKKEGRDTYVATVEDLFGCSGSDTLEVDIVAAPKSEDRELCENDSLVVDASRYSNYEWEDGYQLEVRTIKGPGQYVLRVADQFGCDAEFSYYVHELPRVALTDTSIFEGESMEYRIDLPSEYGPYRIRWQNGSKDDHLVAKDEGVYSVTIIDNIGCSSQDSTFLPVHKRRIAAPDAFLPGSSSENSKFYLKEVNFVGHFEMFIYDRWGELVYKTNEIGFKGGWNGAFKGMECQAGIYIWVAFSDGKEVGRGTVALIK